MSEHADMTSAASEIASALHALADTQAVHPNRLLTVDELADVLRIPARTLHDQTAHGAFPHRRWGKHIRFSPEDVTEIIRLMYRAPVAASRRNSSG